MISKDVLIAVLATFLLTIIFFGIMPIHSATVYNPWLDVNDDGRVDMRDIGAVCNGFGGRGASVNKSELLYDSGWIDITNMTGKNIEIIHSLNLENPDDSNIAVDTQGKASIEGDKVLRCLGLTNFEPEWNLTYGELGYEIAFCLAKTSDGGYVAAGTNGNFRLAKIDSYGNLQWNNTYARSGGGVAFSVIQTYDGGYAMVGFSGSVISQNDFWLVKTDGDGNAQWNMTYESPFDDCAYSVVQTADGGYALGGTKGFDSGNSDFWLIRTDTNGNTLWNRTFDNTIVDLAWDMIKTDDGGFLIAGDNWLVKTDSEGTLQWSRTLAMPYFALVYAIVQTDDGGYALTGESYEYGGNSDIGLIKVDSNGIEQWGKTYDSGVGLAQAWGIVQTEDHGYTLAGLTDPSDSNNYDAIIIKVDTDGNMQWNQTYEGAGDEELYSIVYADDGGYVVAGWTTSFGTGGAWIVKTHSDPGEYGLIMTGFTENVVTLYRGTTDTYWNYVRVRIWKTKKT